MQCLLVWIVWSFTCTAQAAGTVLVYGDSLSAAYGLARDQGWVSLLAERLAKEKIHYNVANASISGETSAGGATRIERTLSQHKPDIVVLALGANDGLRGLPIQQLKTNLTAIIKAAQSAKARVVLVGMQMPPNYGPQYTQAFANVFTELARQYKTALVPFLLAVIADKNQYFQSDNLHPTADAQPLILETVWKELAPMVRK
ncbi:MAG: arylesterase [Betaproteobacteria bacterium]|nr:arylesterase [Betaproteobacteria bacterium]